MNPTASQPESILEPIKRDRVCESLDMIVKDFNEKFATWSRTSGCVANFGWRYDPHGRKEMEIQGIDMILYRKDAPRADNLAAVMKQYEDKP